MKLRFLLTIALAAAVSGCATPPKSAQEFRQYVGKTRWITLEKFEVKRPFRQVARTFQRRSQDCLQIRITTVSQSSRSISRTQTTYRPTVKVGRKHAELYIQAAMTGVVHIAKEADGGAYILVADAYPAGRNKTRIELYRTTMGYSTLIKAVRGWATGENRGCPDLTK